jgi:lysophospholipase L1-like esterase
MRTLQIAFLLASTLLGATCFGQPSTRPATQPTTVATIQSTTAPTTDRWRREIDAYLRADEQSPPPEGAIVFTGSSSIRGWRTLENDFAGLDVFGRGFGGSSTIDVVRYADVLVIKHRPRMVVFYCGENDLTAKGTTPDDVYRHFRTFVDLVHRELPQTKIVFISLKPSPSRIALIEKFRETNTLIKSYIDTDPRLSYVDVFSAMLDEKGQPRPELFLSDKLHMTPAGYSIWTKLVRPHLE